MVWVANRRDPCMYFFFTHRFLTMAPFPFQPTLVVVPLLCCCWLFVWEYVGVWVVVVVVLGFFVVGVVKGKRAGMMEGDADDDDDVGREATSSPQPTHHPPSHLYQYRCQKLWH